MISRSELEVLAVLHSSDAGRTALEVCVLTPIPFKVAKALQLLSSLVVRGLVENEPGVPNHLDVRFRITASGSAAYAADMMARESG